jgi:hypothetical protein
MRVRTIANGMTVNLELLSRLRETIWSIPLNTGGMYLYSNTDLNTTVRVCC